MKKILIVIMCLYSIANLNAQIIARQVISAAGGILTGGDNQISFTIGESAVSTLNAGGYIITQGFQQPGEELKTNSISGNHFCPLSILTIPFSSIDIGGNNIFTAQLSDANGSFTRPLNIGTITGNATSGVITGTIPVGIPPGNNYRFRVVSTFPPLKGSDNGTNISIDDIASISEDVSPVAQTVFINSQAPSPISIIASGTTLRYQWYSNNNNNNSNGHLIDGATGNSYTPSTMNIGTLYYYCVTTSSCNSKTSSIASVTVTNINTWKGEGTTDWSLASNWRFNQVPDGSNNAVIPLNKTPYPVLSTSVAIGNLIIDPTASVSIGANTFTLNGTVSGGGTISGSAVSNLITNSTTSIHFTTGSNILKNLTVNSGSLTLSNALEITPGTIANTFGTVTVINGAMLVSGGNLIIKSNQFGTARVAEGAVAGNYIIGDVTVERYINQNAKRAWRLLSIPTLGTQTIKQSWQENQAAGANSTPGFGTIITHNITTTLPALFASGFDEATPAPSIQSYNSATQSWVSLTSTNSTPIQTNKGYFMYIRGDRSITASTSSVATVATVLRTSGTLYQGNAGVPITVDAGKFEPVGNIYVSAIDFTKLSKTGGISNTFYLWDAKLLSGASLGAYQTFALSTGWIPVTPGGSYPALPNTAIESGAAFMVGAIGTVGTITLHEDSKTTGNQFNPFRPSSTPSQFRTSLYKISTSIPILADNNVVVFDRIYSSAVDVNDALKIPRKGEDISILNDKKNLIIDARQPLVNDDTIYFVMNNLQMQKYKLEFNTINMDTNGLTAFIEDNYLQTKTVVNLKNISDYYFTTDSDYNASHLPDRFKIVFKKTVAPLASDVKSDITLSPNPIVGSSVNLYFKNQPPGRYNLRLLNSDGKTIQNKIVEHTGINSTITFTLNNKLSGGNYQLEIISPDKNKRILPVIISQ